MLVTDGGQLIRTPVEGIRIAGRSTQGVIVFDTAEASACLVERISEEGDEKRRLAAAGRVGYCHELATVRCLFLITSVLVITPGRS